MVKNEGLLKVKKAAALLGVAPRTIYAWVAERRIPFRKAGRLLRFERAALLAWSEEQARDGRKDEGSRVVVNF